MAGGQFCHRRKGTDSSVDLSVVRVDGSVRAGGRARRRKAIDSCSTGSKNRKEERGKKGEEKRRIEMLSSLLTRSFSKNKVHFVFLLSKFKSILFLFLSSSFFQFVRSCFEFTQNVGTYHTTAEPWELRLGVTPSPLSHTVVPITYNNYDLLASCPQTLFVLLHLLFLLLVSSCRSAIYSVNCFSFPVLHVFL